MNHRFYANCQHGMVSKKENLNLGGVHKNLLSRLRKLVDYYFQFSIFSADEY